MPTVTPASAAAASRGAERQYWRGATTLRPSAHRGVPRPARIPQHAARQRDQVRVAFGDDRLCLLWLGDQSDRHRDGAGRAANRARQWHLVAGTERDLLRRRHAAARHVDPIAAARDEAARELDRVVERDAAVDPVDRRDSHTHRLCCRPRSTHGVEDRERAAACGPRDRHQNHRCGGWRAARGIRATDSRAPCAARARRCRRDAHAPPRRRTRRGSRRSRRARARREAPRALNAESPTAPPAATRHRQARSACRLPRGRPSSPCALRARVASRRASRAPVGARVPASSRARSRTRRRRGRGSRA